MFKVKGQAIRIQVELLYYFTSMVHISHQDTKSMLINHREHDLLCVFLNARLVYIKNCFIYHLLVAITLRRSQVSVVIASYWHFYLFILHETMWNDDFFTVSQAVIVILVHMKLMTRCSAEQSDEHTVTRECVKSHVYVLHFWRTSSSPPSCCSCSLLNHICTMALSFFFYCYLFLKKTKHV